MLLQQREPGSKAAYAQPEHIFPFAAEDAPDQAPAQTSDPDDPPDWHAFGPHALDQQAGFLAPLKAVVGQCDATQRNRCTDKRTFTERP
jgi:hypothetical protein